MTIIELSNNTIATGFTNYERFVFRLLPAKVTLADYWITTFGASDQSTTLVIDIIAFIENFLTNYTETNSVNDCVNQEESFYFDQQNQDLYVHFNHESSWYTSIYEYGTFFGFSDSKLVYLDNFTYDPLILSVPGIAQQQDLVGYDKLAFLNGTIELNNKDAILDRFITENIYGNDVFMYWIDDEKIEGEDGTRSDLVRQAAFYVEDYNLSLNSISLQVQDQRKSQNAKIATDLFLLSDYPDIQEKYINQPIPLAYGAIREQLCTPTNGEVTTGNVKYRQALTLTSLGTIEVEVDEVWTAKTALNINLATGEFELASSDGRNANGSLRKVKAIGSIGIANTYAADIIKDINERYLGIEFLSSTYDTTEWNSEQTALVSIGVLWEKQIDVFEAIRQVQNGSNVGFRYEVLPDKRRTIRIDDEDRTPLYLVPNVDIQNIDSLQVETDSELVFSEVEIQYNQDYVEEFYSSVLNDDFRTQVFSNYRQSNRLISETFLTNLSDAQDRAENDAETFSQIPQIGSVVLMGEQYLTLRIFDIINIEMTPGFVNADIPSVTGREYYGIVKAKVVGIDPSITNRVNNVAIKILGEA